MTTDRTPRPATPAEIINHGFIAEDGAYRHPQSGAYYCAGDFTVRPHVDGGLHLVIESDLPLADHYSKPL